jgi:ABC-type transport system substrate-binding protein
LRWHNDTYLTLVEEARQLTNQAERMRLYQQADKILVEEAAIIPLYYHQAHSLVKSWISRFPTSPLSLVFWKDVVIEPH